MNPQHWEYVYLLQGRLDNSVGLYLSLCMSRVKNYAVNRTPPPTHTHTHGLKTLYTLTKS